MSDSDVDSIISEEEAAGYGTDGSDEMYDPNAADNEPSPEKHKAQKPVPAPSVLPSVVVTAYGKPATAYVVPTSKVISAGVGAKSQNQSFSYSVDYSQTFDDDFEKGTEEESNNYSNDFDFEGEEEEVLATPNLKSKADRSAKKRPDTDDEKLRPKLGVQLPSLGIQSLQAELAIDEIGREVVRLRNKQKALLRERQSMAKEKKLRAEQRRQQYLHQMNDFETKLAAAAAETESLNGRLQLSISQHQSCQATITLLEQSLSEEQRTVRILKENIGELNTMLKDRDVDINRLKENTEKMSTMRKREVEEMNLRLQRAELVASVVQRSMETAEERLVTHGNFKCFDSV
jgi:hypothetical protein